MGRETVLSGDPPDRARSVGGLHPAAGFFRRSIGGPGPAGSGGSFMRNEANSRAWQRARTGMAREPTCDGSHLGTQETPHGITTGAGCRAKRSQFAEGQAMLTRFQEMGYGDSADVPVVQNEPNRSQSPPGEGPPAGRAARGGKGAIPAQEAVQRELSAPGEFYCQGCDGLIPCSDDKRLFRR